ncbi:MAG TPA: ATP-binding protein, partial [Thermoplasmatales archaeon]|nr:ATP-binding protein [Thermoplasmatales archaeon]
MFVDRKEELDILEKKFMEKQFHFFPIYGRRRVGKTELIKQFIKDKKAIYFLATSGSKRENIERFKEAAKEIIDISFVTESWREIFEYLSKHLEEKTIIVIDEFPYLVETEKGLSSIFQYIVDMYLSNTNNFLILCGSSLGMMYKEVLGYRAPLYGRRTGQLEISPLSFKESAGFFKDKKIREKIEIYSICGGVPAYLKEFMENKNIFTLIKEKILSKGSPLLEEIPFILRQEFREPKTYMSILSAISLGNRNLGKIVNYCGFQSKTGIMPYLYNLENLGYIKRELPVTEKPRSKRGLYFISDNYFDFWFKFIRRNMSLIEIDIRKAL